MERSEAKIGWSGAEREASVAENDGSGSVLNKLNG